MYRVRTTRCACCDLELDIAVAIDATAARAVCARCAPHQGTAASVASRRDADHAGLYRDALEHARDEMSLAHGERDFYRDRSITLAKKGETLVRTLTKIDDLHRGLRHSAAPGASAACSCGARDCRVRALLVDPAVSRLIGTYDEEQHTLYELRRANPGACADEWDYIDVTLVYPPQELRPVGRHRVAD